MSETNKLQALEAENTKLQQLIQELEKRLSAISNAQTAQSQLFAIRDYFDELEAYLNALNNMYETHMLSFENYSTQISILQDQMDTISTKINAMPNWEELNINEINYKIENLSLNVADALDQLDAIQQSSDVSISSLSNDIQALQTEISYIQEDIDSAITEINSINSNLGAMQTTITNLNSTQNSLNSAQNSLSGTLTGIESRLTTTENNISTLTGGIDVGEIDSRIIALENAPKVTTMVAKNKYPMFLNVPANETYYSLFYYYKTDSADCVCQNFNIKYTSTGSGTLGINLLQNNDIVKQFSINLEEHPNECEIEFYYYTTDKYQSFQFSFTPSTEISFNELEATIIGANVQLYETDKELKASCYNNYIYITRYDDNKIKCARFSINDLSIEPSALTERSNWVLNSTRCAMYGPRVSSSSDLITHAEDYVVLECAKTNKMYCGEIDAQTLTFEDLDAAKDPINYSGVVTMTPHLLGQISVIHENSPGYKNAASSLIQIKTYANLSDFKSGKWFFNTVVEDNNYVLGNTVKATATIKTLAVYEDGYMYIILNNPVTGVTKIGKGGKYATGYYQSDGTINVYINHYNSTDVYNITIADDGSATPTFIETIQNCDCVYEILGNQKILHKNGEWIIESSVAEEPEIIN